MLATAVYFGSLLAQAVTAAPAASPGGQSPAPAFTSFVPLIFIGVIFYFVLLRPQQKRAKEQAVLLASVRSGDEVVVGGLHGIVTNAREAGSKTVLVKFAENVKIEVDRSAIVNVIKPGGAETEEPAAITTQKG